MEQCWVKFCCKMACVAEIYRFGARALAQGAKIWGFDRRVPSCDKKLPYIASTSEKTEESTTKALDFYFNVGYSVFRKQLSSQRYVPISAGPCAHATKPWKITRFGQNRLGNSRTTFRARAINFSRGDIAPQTHTYSESPFQGLSEYIWVWGSTCPHCGDMGSRSPKPP